MQTNEGEDIQQEVEAAETEVEALEGQTEEEKDTTDWKAKFEEADGRLRRAEKKLKKSEIDTKVEAKLKEKTGELDETQLDYLDLKGISDSEDLKVIEKHLKQTGETVRQALKDDYVLSKLNANKAARDLKDATPSSTKRTGSGQNNDLSLAIAKAEATGKLPDDFALRTQVVNALVAKSTDNKPAWH